MNFIKRIYRRFFKRNVTEVFKQIKDLLPEELQEKLEAKAAFWAPEYFWEGLTRFVNKYVIPDSENEMSVNVYACLCDVSPDNMKKQFIRKGF